MGDQDQLALRDRGRFVKGQRPPRSWEKGDGPSRGGLWGTLEMQRELQGAGGSHALRKLFRRKSIVVMHALQRVILDPETPAAVKVAAAQLMLERAWGKVEAKPAKPAREKTKAEPPVIVINRVPRPPKPDDV